MSSFSSWGNYPQTSQLGCLLSTRHDNLNSLPRMQGNQSFLPYGLGRSYGDSCRNHKGFVVSSQSLKNFIDFNPESGLLRCESGVSLADIIDCCLPHGWFLPVTPGTKYVTIAGAIANDVHGKNHHSAGSFGNHIVQFELLRSDGSRLMCSENKNPEWFYATIGGLGLTGFITWAEVKLKPVKSRMIESENIKYPSLQDFFTIAEDSISDFEYTVAWLDCSAQGASLGRGHFSRGNHASMPPLSSTFPIQHKAKLSVPVTPPLSLINNMTVKAFNQLYYNRQREGSCKKTIDYDPFFYPLDGVLKWNRIYGAKGFLQHQCLIPKDNADLVIKELLERIAAAGLGSFLVVLKTMGNVASKGLLSFAKEGVTLAIDFPYQGQKTLDFLSSLDEVVEQAHGSLYPAKDARMSGDLFKAAYPNWNKLESLRDPQINSDFWRRVTGVE